jgi:hypothetical protein
MKGLHVRLGSDLATSLRLEAMRQGRSMAVVAREALEQHLLHVRPIPDLTWIGAYESRREDVSERTEDALTGFGSSLDEPRG